MPGSSCLARAQRPGAADHSVLDLLEGEADQALRRPAGLVEHVDQQLQLGLAVDPAVPADALDQPLRVLGRQIALGLGLLDQVVGDGLDEAVCPGRVLHGTGIVQGEDDVGLLGRDATVVVVVAAQLEDIGVLDAAARLDLRDRDRVQYCHNQPPANPGKSYGFVVTILLISHPQWRFCPCRVPPAPRRRTWDGGWWTRAAARAFARATGGQHMRPDIPALQRVRRDRGWCGMLGAATLLFPRQRSRLVP